MPIIQPSKERHQTQENGSSLNITIPSRKNYLTILFLGFWLIGWAVGEVIVSGILIAGIVDFLFNPPEASGVAVAGSSGVSLFLLVWLGMWTVGGAFALHTFFWQLVGKEIIEVGTDSIKIKRAIFGMGRVKEYLSTHVKDLRIAPLASNSNIFGMPRTMNFWGMTNDGHIAFDYGAQTLRFCDGVDEAEAKQILKKIVSRFPQYRVRRSEVG